MTDRLSKRVFDHKKHQTIKILICFPSLNRKKLAKISELSSNTLDYAGKKIRKLKNAVLDSYNFQNVDFFQKNIFFETFWNKYAEIVPWNLLFIMNVPVMYKYSSQLVLKIFAENQVQGLKMSKNSNPHNT